MRLAMFRYVRSFARLASETVALSCASTPQPGGAGGDGGRLPEDNDLLGTCPDTTAANALPPMIHL